MSICPDESRGVMSEYALGARKDAIVSQYFLWFAVYRRQSDDNSDKESIKEMLKVLLRKLDKTAAADVTGEKERSAYNVSRIQHENESKNSHDIIPDHVRLACF